MTDDVEERMLIFAPMGKDAALTCKLLHAAELGCHPCRGADELLAEMKAGLAGLLLVEETLTPDFVRRLTRWIANQPSWSDLPVLLCTSAGASSPVLATPIQTLGNVTILERPIRALALISAVGSALRARKRQYGLREAERRKDEFLASLGHELRNPLAPIRTTVGILKRYYPDAPEVTRIADVVERHVSHLTRLIDDLLDVARITRGKVALRRAPTTVAAVIAQAVEMCAALAAKAGHVVAVTQPAGEIALVADHARLVQSVGNVLANAIKFTPEPGRIEVSAEPRGECVVIRVKDPGIGLPADTLPRIFDLFEQGDVAAGGSKAGLGIGLSLAQRFIAMHGGSIRASSEGRGHGSEFTMTIPRNPLATQAGGTRGRAVAGPAAAGPARARVLVVDDNRDTADMFVILFEAEGYAARAAYDGREALTEADRFRPDVVVMDLGMPGLDGYETARRLRATARGGALLLIALTGWGQEGTRTKAIAAGFDFHVVKPVDFETLKGYIVQS